MRLSLLLWLCTLALAGNCRAQDLISIRGSTVVARALAMAAPALEKEHNIRINFVAEPSGLELADKLGRDVFDIALYTRRMTGQETALRPEKKYTQTMIGRQAVMVVVPDQVWASGVRALTKEQLRAIYENEITNWKAVGGEDRPIVYFNRESGRGIWDLFMIFLYGDVRRAPLSKAEVLNDPNDVRTAVEFNGGSLSLLEHGEMQGDRVHALGIKQPDGSVVEAAPANFANGKYELSRPLYLVTGKNPTGKVRVLIEFMLSDEGQECVRKAGHVPLAMFEGKAEAER
jgi:phosphate transport system substrate-binding protein